MFVGAVQKTHSKPLLIDQWHRKCIGLCGIAMGGGPFAKGGQSQGPMEAGWSEEKTCQVQWGRIQTIFRNLAKNARLATILGSARATFGTEWYPQHI